jgi:hypothetical protein
VCCVGKAEMPASCADNPDRMRRGCLSVLVFVFSRASSTATFVRVLLVISTSVYTPCHKRLLRAGTRSRDEFLLTTCARAAQTRRSVRQSNGHTSNGIKPSQRDNSPMHCKHITSTNPTVISAQRTQPAEGVTSRRPSEPMHMEVRRPRTRQQSIETQPSLLHASIMESNGERK